MPFSKLKIERQTAAIAAWLWLILRQTFSVKIWEVIDARTLEDPLVSGVAAEFAMLKARLFPRLLLTSVRLEFA